MNPETNPVTVDTRYGKLLVAVSSAKEDSFHDWERGNVTELRPRVRIASDPTFEADPGHVDHWTIRGRAYAVHQTVYFRDLSKADYASGTNLDLWHSEESPYRGGFRNDRRAQVEYRTKTYDLMRQAVADALDVFAKEHQGWDDFSVYLLKASKRDSEMSKYARLLKEAEEHKVQGEKFDQEAAPLYESLPADLRALVRT
ncbi:hypothetical protein AB0A69_08070 [Streptomyces sp. NPDC045431]|uniref:hypothetical protein n=1 Tax=Streptomyces sp. NPDC045431 TaxID=3155613 RepID=UPI0033EA614B